MSAAVDIDTLSAGRARLEDRAREQPRDAAAWAALAGALALEGQAERALEAWSRAAAIAGATVEVRLEQAHAAAALARWDVVTDALAAVDPAHVRDAMAAWSASAVAAEAACALGEGPRREAARRAAAALRRQHVALRPHDVAALADLGVLLASLGRAGEAREVLERVARRDPTFFDENPAERAAYEVLS